MTEQEEKIQALETENKALKDEVESLWGMLDEIREADIKNYSTELKKVVDDKILEMKLLSTTKPVDA